MRYTHKHVACLILAVVGGALGQLFLKRSMLVDCAVTKCGLPELILNTEFLMFLIIGVSLYLISCFCWIVALQRFELGFAYPVLSLGYILVYLGAAIPPFSESLSVSKTLGVLLIVTGVVISSQGSASQFARDDV